jgi:hypothetical protein
MKYNETVLSRKDWENIFKHEFLNQDKSLNVNKIKTSLYLYYVLNLKVSDAYEQITAGTITDPQTEPELVMACLEEIEEDLSKIITNEAARKTRDGLA